MKCLQGICLLEYCRWAESIPEPITLAGNIKADQLIN